MKRWLAPIAIIAALTAGTGPALAASAKPEPIDVSYPVPCPGFNVLLHATGNLGLINLPGDRQAITGPNLRVTATALTTSAKSVSYVVTGVTHITFLSNGNQLVTATGLNLTTVPNANGHPEGLFFTKGTTNWVLDKDNNEVGGIFTGNGSVTDVCALLAP